MLALVRRYVRWMLRTPGPILWIALPVLLILFAIALLPQLPLIFDASTHSMEPKSSDAGYALGTIMEKMPTRWEPVIGMVRAPNEQQLHDDWQKIDAHWRELEQAGKIKSFSTPAALALSPQLMEANRQRARRDRFRRGARALEEAIASEGFSRDTFRRRFRFSINSKPSPAAQCRSRIGARRCRKHRAGGFWSIVISRMIRFSRSDS